MTGKKDKSSNEFLAVIYSIILSALLLSVLSFTTSPLYHEPLSGDSAIFWTIGRFWMEGHLPYVELWDLKGPFIFLCNGIGYLITHSISGLFILQILFNAISFYLTFKTLRTEYNTKWAMWLTAIIALGYGALLFGGNRVEEYVLPFITLAVFYIYKWTKEHEKGKTDHNPLHASVYGMVLGLSLMTRLTNAIGICGAVAVIIVTLIIKRRWANLGKNALYFIAGTAITTLPFIIYFYLNDALYEMWYGTVLYNLEYTDSSIFHINSFYGLRKILTRTANCYGLIIIGIMMLMVKDENAKKKVGTTATIWIIMGVLTLLWFLKSFGYGYYMIISIPYAAVVFNELKTICSKDCLMTRKKLFNTILVAYTLLAVTSFAYAVYAMKRMYLFNYYLPIFRQSAALLPDDYKDSFIAYNLNADIYQYEDICPAYPYFALQQYEIGRGQSLGPRVMEQFSSCNAKYIITANGKLLIDNILQQNYILIEKNEWYSLYVRKDILPKIKGMSE